MAFVNDPCLGQRDVVGQYPLMSRMAVWHERVAEGAEADNAYLQGVAGMSSSSLEHVAHLGVCEKMADVTGWTRRLTSLTIEVELVECVIEGRRSCEQR